MRGLAPRVALLAGLAPGAPQSRWPIEYEQIRYWIGPQAQLEPSPGLAGELQTL